MAPQRPGQIISVNQFVSSTPGLIAQISNFLMTKRYKYACDGLCRPLQPNGICVPSGQDGVGRGDGQRKESLQGLCKKTRRPGIQLQCRQRHLQGPPTDGSLPPRSTRNNVRRHHAERRIRELQEMARAMMIHGNARWN